VRANSKAVIELSSRVDFAHDGMDKIQAWGEDRLGTRVSLQRRIRVMRGSTLSLAVLVLTASAASAQDAVYTQTNSTKGNAVVAFHRSAGQLTPAGTFATGGLGVAGGLSTQGPITVTRDGRFVLVVNGGSDDVSVMRIDPSGLTLVDLEPSRGDRPRSITEHSGRVYVLNTEDHPNVAGFTLSPTGDLQPIAAAPWNLQMGSGPVQVGIGPGGGQVFVTERNTNLIDVFHIGALGALGAPAQIPSQGLTPAGFDFGANDTMIVSEIALNASDASSASSYRIGVGTLNTLTAAGPTTETGACFVAVARGAKYAYTTNPISGTVTGFRVMPQVGTLSRLHFDGVTADLGGNSRPTDAATSADGKFLFVISPNTEQLISYYVRLDGSLERLGHIDGFPMSTIGLAAR